MPVFNNRVKYSCFGNDLVKWNNPIETLLFDFFSLTVDHISTPELKPMSLFNKYRSPESEEKKEFLEPGKSFGEYLIIRRINNSIIGCLYLGEHQETKKRVSLMIMPTKTSNDPRFGERFRKLVERLKKLDHPAVLSLIEGAILNRRYVLIYEAVPDDVITLEEYPEAFTSGKIPHSEHPFTLEGQVEQDIEELEEEVLPAEESSGASGTAEAGKSEPGERRSPKASRIPFLSRSPLGIGLSKAKPIGVPYENAAPLFRQVLEALKYIHGEGLDHLSLTPGTVLYYPDGSIKIFNVGLVHTLEKELFERIVSAGISPLLTGNRKLTLNTIDMFSPEIRAGEAYRANSDIYGFGVFCYWFLTGRKAAMGSYQSPRDHQIDIPENWDLFLHKSLNTDPRLRYPTIASQLSDFIKINISEKTGSGNLFSTQFERIPVPGKIRDKGGNFPLIWRVFVLGLLGVASIGIFQLFLPKVIPDETFRGRPVAFTSLEDGNPNLQLRFTPERVKVEFPGSESRFIVLDGTLDLNVKKGVRLISVEAPGHFPREFELDVTSSPLDPIHIELIPQWAKLKVIGTPRTMVTAIGKNGKRTELGIVPGDGILEINEGLMAGTYTLEGNRPDYYPTRIEEVNLPYDDDREVEIYLEPMPGKVEVISQPAGAEVLVNDTVKGKTPLTLEGLPVGKPLEFIVKKTGFREKTESLQLEPNANLLVDFGNLTMKTGEIRPQVFLDGEEANPEQLEELTYTVDGVTFSGNSEIITPVVEGEHTLYVEHPDYLSVEMPIRVGDGRFTPVSIDLQPKPGQLTIRLRPARNYTLEANGQVLESIDRAGTTYYLKPNEMHELELKIRDHLSARKSIVLEPNQREIWEFEPVPIPGPREGENYPVPYVGMEMVFIPQGSFVMGSPPSEIARLPEEGPRTEASLSKPFWIGRYEVTQGQYLHIMESNPSRFKKPDKPVDSVSWNQAQLFCQRLTSIEGRAGRLPEGYVYRLPTEAEWEYAARAGTKTPFHWGDRANMEMGNFKGVYPRDFNEDHEVSGIYGSVEVGSYEPNPWGLYDVHGNLREWVFDNWNARLPGGEVVDHAGPRTGSQKVIRGGGWEDPAQLTRSAVRNGLRPSTTSFSLGFRVVLGPEL